MPAQVTWPHQMTVKPPELLHLNTHYYWIDHTDFTDRTSGQIDHVTESERKEIKLCRTETISKADVWSQRRRVLTESCPYVPRPRCRSDVCSARSSESWRDDSGSSCCTRRCSYTAGGAHLHLDTPSAGCKTHRSHTSQLLTNQVLTV